MVLLFVFQNPHLFKRYQSFGKHFFDLAQNPVDIVLCVYYFNYYRNIPAQTQDICLAEVAFCAKSGYTPAVMTPFFRMMLAYSADSLVAITA